MLVAIARVACLLTFTIEPGIIGAASLNKQAYVYEPVRAANSSRATQSFEGAASFRQSVLALLLLALFDRLHHTLLLTLYCRVFNCNPTKPQLRYPGMPVYLSLALVTCVARAFYGRLSGIPVAELPAWKAVIGYYCSLLDFLSV